MQIRLCICWLVCASHATKSVCGLSEWPGWKSEVDKESHAWLKPWILISWLLQKPPDQDSKCFSKEGKKFSPALSTLMFMN